MPQIPKALCQLNLRLNVLNELESGGVRGFEEPALRLAPRTKPQARRLVVRLRHRKMAERVRLTDDTSLTWLCCGSQMQSFLQRNVFRTLCNRSATLFRKHSVALRLLDQPSRAGKIVGIRYVVDVVMR